MKYQLVAVALVFLAACVYATANSFHPQEQFGYHDTPVRAQAAKLPKANGNLNIYALPVGQGDSTVIQCPKGDITIIDLGSSKSTGFSQKDFINYLYGQKVQAIFVTHSDKYHIINYLKPFLSSLKSQGIPSLLSTTPVLGLDIKFS